MITEIKLGYNDEQEFYFVLDNPVTEESDINFDNGTIEVREKGEVINSQKMSEIENDLGTMGNIFAILTNSIAELAKKLPMMGLKMTTVGIAADYSIRLVQEKIEGSNELDSRLIALSNAVTSYVIHEGSKNLASKLFEKIGTKVLSTWIGALAEPTFLGEVIAILVTLKGSTEVVDEISGYLNGITEISLENKKINWIKNDTENLLEGNIEDIKYFWDNGLKNFSELKTLEGYCGGNSRLRIENFSNGTFGINLEFDSDGDGGIYN